MIIATLEDIDKILNTKYDIEFQNVFYKAVSYQYKDNVLDNNYNFNTQLHSDKAYNLFIVKHERQH